MQFTGERFVPSVTGQISYEHLHRYAIASRFTGAKRVLDIACGEGYGSALLARNALEVIGVDIDEESILHAQRTYYATNVRFVNGSCMEIPLGDASVDVVVCFETLEHVSGQERMLDEFRRVLTPGGVCLISSPNKLQYSDIPDYQNPYHLRELYFAEFRDLLRRRFSHVRIFGQRVTAASLIHPLAGDVSLEATWFSGSVAKIYEGMPAVEAPLYFIGVCSDAGPVGGLSSAYLDPGDDLLQGLFAELNTLRHQIYATYGDVYHRLPAATPLAVPANAGAADDRADDEAQVRARLEDEVNHLSALLHERSQQQAEVEVQIGPLQAKLEEALAAYDFAVAERHREREAAETFAADLTECRAALAAAEQALEAERVAGADAARRASEAIARAEHCGAALDAVLNSRSWKLTSPLRRAVRIVRP